MTLLDACRSVMNDSQIRNNYPDGLDSYDVLAEIHRKFGKNAFPYITVIDVATEMKLFYGV